MTKISVQVLVKSINDTSRVVNVEPGYKMMASPGEQYEVLLNQKPLPLSVELYVNDSDLTLRWDGADLVKFEGWRDLEDHAQLVIATTRVQSGRCAGFCRSG